MQSAEDVARLVFSFVESAGTMVNGLDNEEEVKLLRVRTKKNELVIVPSTDAGQLKSFAANSHRREIHSGRDTRYPSCLNLDAYTEKTVHDRIQNAALKQTLTFDARLPRGARVTAPSYSPYKLGSNIHISPCSYGPAMQCSTAINYSYDAPLQKSFTNASH
jgi:hypothetical protein